jgi:RHS repeat-associated protein
MRPRREKPHQGVRSSNPALHRGHNRCNSRNTLGLRAAEHRNCVRPRCSGEQYDTDLGLYYLRARYMNPVTGRFVSRDPEDGITTDPKTLHKYLYANGDPVNGSDPTGRATAVARPYSPGAIEYGLIVAYISLQAAKSLPQVAQAVSCVFEEAGSLLQGVTTDLGAPIISITFQPQECSVKVKKDCEPRKNREINYCSESYPPTSRGRQLCIARALERYNACLRGLPDPGPLDPIDPDWSIN